MIMVKPFTITSGKISVTFELNETEWHAAEKIEFSDFEIGNDMELALLWIKAVMNDEELLETIFTQFKKKFNPDDHSPHYMLPGRLEGLDLKEALRIYLEADKKKYSCVMKDGLVVFGGQACSDDLITELKDICDTYDVKELLTEISTLLCELSHDKDARDNFTSGFDILSWVKGTRPSEEYVLSAPVSLPLIGVIQLLNYYTLGKNCGGDFKAFKRMFKCTTGHSQGIVPAAVIAIAEDEASFFKGCLDAVRTLFWIGLYAHYQSTDTIAEQIKEDCVQKGEGTPSRMLAISGLSRELLDKYIGRVKGVEIGLQNGHKAFVACGLVTELYNLVLLLREIQAGGEDQSRIPFHERKQRFTLKFLPISAPFHSSHLKAAVPLIMNKLCNVSFFKSNGSINIIHTETGKLTITDYILILLGSLMKCCDVQELVEQICVKPVNWPKCISGKDVDHLLDFGPGHKSGIGSISARILDGTSTNVQTCPHMS